MRRNERSNVVKTIHDVELMPIFIGEGVPKKYNQFTYYDTHDF